MTGFSLHGHRIDRGGAAGGAGSGGRAGVVAAAMGGASAHGPLGSGPTPAAIAATTLSAVLRAAAAVLAGLVLVSGSALVLWALTPGDGSDSAVAVRGGAVAFAAAHFLPVSFSGAAISLSPLLLTGVMIAVVATSAGRARMVRGRLLEALHVSVFVVIYAVGIDAASAALAPTGTVRAGLAGPLAVGSVGAAAALAFHATAWRGFWRAAAPPWLQVGVRGALVATLALLTAGAAALAAGLIVAFPHVATVAGLTVRAPGDALGMTLLCLAFLPNAVIAAVGYVTGAGFSVGAATFSPLAVHHAELPAIPLLAAAPEHASSAAAWVVLIGPVAAAALAGVLIVRGTTTRRDRLAACGVTAAVAAVAVAALAAVSGGGVAGGAWAAAGAPALVTGGLVAGITLVVTIALAVSTGWRPLPWSARLDDGAVLVTGPEPADAEVDDAEPADSEAGDESLADSEGGDESLADSEAGDAEPAGTEVGDASPAGTESGYVEVAGIETDGAAPTSDVDDPAASGDGTSIDAAAEPAEADQRQDLIAGAGVQDAESCVTESSDADPRGSADAGLSDER